MMELAKINSASIVGLASVPVEVEVDISAGLPAFSLVGLPDKAVEESKERVRSAIKNSNAHFPPRHLTVNLAPADLPKYGPAYDLPIAVGILYAAGQLKYLPERALFFGELSLDGTTRATNGVLSLALMAKEQNFGMLFIPADNAEEAALVDGIDIRPVKSLKELITHLLGEKEIEPYKAGAVIRRDEIKYDFDFENIKGQEQAKRALEIAAAGGHNVLLNGPPGTGKTLLARALPSILPEMVKEEQLEVTKIFSVAGLLKKEEPLICTRPFRSPHHTSSDIALVGGGAHPRPGEITLAHRGVLFLDELPEFPRSVLEALRQPLEDGVITVSRAAGTITFPAKFVLVASMNPCPCGYFSDPSKNCICTATQIMRYQKKVSGPLLDRIDLHVEVPRVEYDKLASEEKGESSASIRKRVQKARDIQTKRFLNSAKKITTNAEMGVPEIKEYCRINEQGAELLRTAVTSLNLSARAFHRVLKVSRTIADLANSDRIETEHLAEALMYRPKERE
jgi:magnesium chelatase family protein